MLQYAIYARKSKDDKSGQIKSIEDQKNICRQVATDLGLTVVEWYEENKTATIPDARPIYRQMIAAIRAGKIDAILVWHINRLARNPEEGGSLAQMLIDGRIREIRTPQSVYHPGDNILPLLLEQATAAQYSIDLSRAVIRGMDSSVEAGGWPHLAPLGYVNARDPINPKRGRIGKDAERFELTHRGFQMMLTGAYSVRTVVDRMNDWGLRRRPAGTMPERPISYSHGYVMFSNPFYAGFTVHKGVLRKGSHPAIVSVEEYNRLQHILKATRRGSRKQRRDFAFTGLIKCGMCGHQITAEFRHKSGKDRIYYHCSDPYRRCTKKGITEEALQERILEQLRALTLDAETCRIALEAIGRWSGRQVAAVTDTLQLQEERLKTIEQQRRNLLDMAISGALSDQLLYRQKDEELLSERTRIVLELEKVRQANDHLRSQAQVALSFVERGLDRFAGGTPAQKREIASALASGWQLRVRDLEFAIDPLLEPLVTFARRIRDNHRDDQGECGRDAQNGPLEPSKSFALRSEKTGDRSSVLLGWDPQTLIELPDQLVDALSNAQFPDLFGTTDTDLGGHRLAS